MRRVDPGDEILMVSHEGLTVRFREEDARSMGRDTSGVRGMDVSGVDNYVLAMDVARDETELLVVTENGYGKRTPISEYRKTNRGTKGVGTIKLTEAKGALAGALIVREHEDLVFISQNGMVQRTGVSGISQMGRPTQGVRVMNIRDDDRVSAVALVMEDSASTAAAVAEDGPDAEPLPDGTDVEALEGADAGDIGADDASGAAHGEGAEPRGAEAADEDT